MISGKNKGKVDYFYTYEFRSSDSDGDDVDYYVEWGDGTNSNWVGHFSSGEKALISHEWKSNGSYTIRAKSRDIYGVESDWNEFEINMPKSYFNYLPLYRWIRILFQLFTL